jgi:hypothetical protein
MMVELNTSENFGVTIVQTVISVTNDLTLTANLNTS